MGLIDEMKNQDSNIKNPKSKIKYFFKIISCFHYGSVPVLYNTLIYFELIEEGGKNPEEFLQGPEFYIPINQSTNQPINQSTNQPINQLTN